MNRQKLRLVMKEVLSAVSLTAIWLIAVMLIMTGCSGLDKKSTSTASDANRVLKEVGLSSEGARLFKGGGPYRFDVTTNDKTAAKYMSQGMVLTYAFNHDEAIRSFLKAAELDDQCAMAWWGVSLASGMHINNPVMTEVQSKQAWLALQEARKRATFASTKEKMLIEALAKRYEWPIPENRAELDKAYAAAMKKVHQQYPEDADIATLYAESVMNTTPWNYWLKDGVAVSGTEDLVPTLEATLRMHPGHPGANHLYIHVMESSPSPEKAMKAADILRTAVPGASHLVHMPSHIDVRVGAWKKAAQSNRDAIRADTAYLKVAARPGFYAIYSAHNYHFLAWTGMMLGRPDEALKAAEGMEKVIPAELTLSQPEFVDPFFSIKGDIYKRFGMWEEILAMPEPRKELVLTKAMWHFNRGVALANVGRVDDAEAELAKLIEIRAKLPASRIVVISPADQMLEVAQKMLEGEMAYKRGELEVAISLLKEAVSAEDKLLYMEPPEWLQPVRHTLGAVLLEAGKAAEAEKVYLADLKKWPENPWSLKGLASAQERLGKTAEAVAINKRFEEAWRDAEVEMNASCKCVN